MAADPGSPSTAKERRFAPPNADGLKPWVRESYHFGETHYSIVYAESAAEARNFYSRMHLETVRARRATVADVEAFRGR